MTVPRRAALVIPLLLAGGLAGCTAPPRPAPVVSTTRSTASPTPFRSRGDIGLVSIGERLHLDPAARA